VAEVSTAPKATAGARAAKKRKKMEACDWQLLRGSLNGQVLDHGSSTRRGGRDAIEKKVPSAIQFWRLNRNHVSGPIQLGRERARWNARVRHDTGWDRSERFRGGRFA